MLIYENNTCILEEILEIGTIFLGGERLLAKVERISRLKRKISAKMGRESAKGEKESAKVGRKSAKAEKESAKAQKYQPKHNKYKTRKAGFVYKKLFKLE